MKLVLFLFLLLPLSFVQAEEMGFTSNTDGTLEALGPEQSSCPYCQAGQSDEGNTCGDMSCSSIVNRSALLAQGKGDPEKKNSGSNDKVE